MCRYPRRSRAFTLIEILVVIAIILLTTVIALPLLQSSLNGRQAVDAAQVIQGAIAGARDAAIRQNEIRGIRLLPDPKMTLPGLGSPTAGMYQLAYNRIVPIEPAGDYTEGKLTIGPQLPPGLGMSGFPPPYPRDASGSVYPYFPSVAGIAPKVLMVEESPFIGGYVPTVETIGGTVYPRVPNSPTNWYWNIRVGDKVRLNGSGRSYTVVGPLTISPWGNSSKGTLGNPELFVNVGLPGTNSPLLRTFYDQNYQVELANVPVEFLFLVDGLDDDGDGFVDDGWDGYDNQANGLIDELAEWEQEAWSGLSQSTLTDSAIGSPVSPSQPWVIANNHQGNTWDQSYTIERRPVPTAGARETLLPVGIVIDATCGIPGFPNATMERSRLPVTPGSLYVDIMMNPNGQYVPTTIYSTPTSAPSVPFLHFWLTDRGDVYPDGTVWGTGTSGPNPPPNGTPYRLPMASDACSTGNPAPTTTNFYYPPASNLTAPVLQYDRRLVTFFCKSGMVVTNEIQTSPPIPRSTNPPSPARPGEGFNVNDVNQPFYKAQLGQREVR